MGVGQSLSPPYMVLPEDPETFFCMCAFSLEVARAFFPWNGSFSLKQRKIIAFQKPAEILHKWILQVYILYSSLFLDWGNQEISAVLQSFNGTNLQLWQNDGGRNAPGRVQYASTIIPKHHSWCETRYHAEIWFEGLYVLQPFKDPHEVHKLLMHPDCQALTCTY